MGRGQEQFLPFAVTVAGVVFTDLLLGVGMGMAVAVIIILQRNYRNSHFLHRHEETADGAQRVVTMRLAEEVTFLNKGAIRKELSRLPNNVRLVIDQSNCVFINHDVEEIIADFAATAPARGIRVEIIARPPDAATVANGSDVRFAA